MINKKIKVDDKELHIGELIAYAVSQSKTAQNFEELTAKKRLLAKLGAEDEPTLTTDEIQTVKLSCLSLFKDGITIAIIDEIAPHDLV